MEDLLSRLQSNPLQVTFSGDPVEQAASVLWVKPETLRLAIESGSVETLHGYAAPRGFYRPKVRIFFAR